MSSCTTATRRSPPQINNVAAQGEEITLADPPGLYLTGIMVSGMKTPDGANPKEFWTVERGDDDHVLRARFEVPAELGYTVNAIKIRGRPIRFGAQMAEWVGVRLSARVIDAGQRGWLRMLDR